MAEIYNSESNTLLNGTSGDDDIRNGIGLSSAGGSNVTINAGEGNDTINNSFGSYATINGGAGNDYIDNNFSSQVTIEGGAGNDYIYNGYHGDEVLFKYASGDGNDTIVGFNATSTLSIGDGEGTYSTQMSGNDVIITVGDGKITLKNALGTTDELHINDETISLPVPRLILADNGDSIENRRDKATINGGAGNDTIENLGDSVTIDAGAGNDSIYNSRSNATINAGDGDDSIQNNNASNVTINGGAGNDSIYNYHGDYVTINGGAGNDTIYNNGENVSINGGKGNDYIDNNYANSVTIEGGTGNDSIYISGSNVTINAGAGNDYIKNYWGNNVVINYASGDGNDIIDGFEATSTLSISGGTYSTQISSNDVIVTVGDGKITLKNALGTTDELHINDETISLPAPRLILADNDDSIENRKDKATIDGGAGDDSISNRGHRVSIDAGADNDTINNSWGYYVTINAGAGNDSIRNFYGFAVIINAGVGDDSIDNREDCASIDAGDGNDYIVNEYGSDVTINAGDGKDSIVSEGNNNTISGGMGNDRVSLVGTEQVFQYAAGDGNDTIIGFNESDTLTITGGSYSTQMSGNDVIVTVGDGKILLVGAKGKSLNINKSSSTKLITLTDADDTLLNYMSEVTINAGAGNDSIDHFRGNNVLINGGGGNDKIFNQYGNYVTNVTINAGAGDDSIYNDVSSVLIDTGDGDDYIDNNGDNVSINGGKGNDDIENGGNNVNINAGDGDDSIGNAIDCDSITIDAGAGNDYIYSGGINAKIKAGVGNDYIQNSGYSVTIDGGAGNDTIGNYRSMFSEPCNNVTINAGTGEDYIYNEGDNVIINAGDGDDYIYNEGVSNVTINAGVGDDSIDNIGNYVTINAGDGNDTIYNNYYSQDDESILQYFGYGSNVLFSYNAGDGNDVIYGFKENSTLLIGGSYSSQVSGDDVIVTVGDGSVVLKDVATLSKVNVMENPLFIVGTKDADTINSTLDGATIKALGGDDTINNGGTNVTFAYGNGDGNDTIVGFNETSTLSITGDNYSATKSGNDIIVTVGDGSITLKDTANLSKVNIDDKNILDNSWTLDDTTAIYGNSIETLISVDGVKSLSGISLSGSTVTVSNAALNKAKVTISDGYTLKLGEDVTKPSASTAWSLNKTTATYKHTTTAGYTLADNAINYSAKAVTTLATVKGVKSLDGLKLSKKVITVSASALNKKSVTVSGDGYTLKLGSDVTKTSTSAAKWTLSGTTATYKSAKTSAGYKLTDNKISYVTASGGSTLATVKGVKSTGGLSVNNKVVTVSNASLNRGTVTISDGYTLKLGKDVTKSTTKPEGWTISGLTATYKAAATTAGYTLADNKISYVKASGGETLATVKGFKSTSGLKLSGKTVTVFNASLNKKTVTLTGDGFTLKLGKDVTKSKTTAAKWSISKTTATYKAASTTVGYSLADNKISYKSASGGSTLATVKGVKSTSGLKLSGKTVTVSAKSLNKSNVTISKGYTLKLSGISAPKTTTAWTISGTTASLKSTTSESYTVKSNKIIYTPQKITTQVELTGLAKKVKASSIGLPANKVLTLKANVLGTKTTLKSNSGGYSINLTGNMKSKSFVGTSGADKINIVATKAKVSAGGGNDSVLGGSGNDSIYGDAGKDTLRGGKGNDVLIGGAGNDSLWGDAGKDTFIYSSGDGKDVIFGFENNDLLQITGAFSAPKYNSSKKEVAFKVGSGSITLKDFGSTTLFHVNDTIYQLSGGKFSAK